MITLNNISQNKDEILQRCFDMKCLYEHNILSKCLTDDSFKKVFLENFYWLNKNNILDEHFVFAGTFKQGFSIVYNNNNWAIINENGVIVKTM